ncbi:transposase [Thioploca ingrica]|uniref:Transposase n=1 Tax=Thioploca ingrica TaxID=40754 RepID=A0A090AH07_9GAMM|nr:transposase [Thioploca ingrica]
MFTGAINANTFSAWVAQDLLPQLPPNGVVVPDNATFHNRADIRPLWEPAGPVLEYLPTYSPHLIPLSVNGHKLKPFVTKESVQLRNSLCTMTCNHFIMLYMSILLSCLCYI